MAFASLLVNHVSCADHGNSVPASLHTKEEKVTCLHRSDTSDLDKLVSLQRDVEGKSFVCIASPGI